MTPTVTKLLHTIGQAIYDKQGFNILGLDVKEVCSMTDYFIIAEGNVDRHLNAIAGAIIESSHKIGERPIMTEGEAEGNWIVIDFGDVVVHLFLSDYREKYELEKVWSNGKIYDLEIKIKKESH